MFLEPYASQNRLSEIIPELWQTAQRHEAWEFYLHKVSGKTFSAFLKDIGEGQGRPARRMTPARHEDLLTALKDQREVFSAFQRRQ